MNNPLPRFLAALLLLAFIGCGNPHGTASASGTVLYKNAPVDGATVNFLPRDDSPTAKPGHGKTDSRGRFTLATYFTPDDQPAGALPGEYAVTITKIDEPQGAYDPHKDPPLKNHLPTKYASPQRSPLKATIQPGSNQLEFKLED